MVGRHAGQLSRRHGHRSVAQSRGFALALLLCCGGGRCGEDGVARMAGVVVPGICEEFGGKSHASVKSLPCDVLGESTDVHDIPPVLSLQALWVPVVEGGCVACGARG